MIACRVKVLGNCGKPTHYHRKQVQTKNGTKGKEVSGAKLRLMLKQKPMVCFSAVELCKKIVCIEEHYHREEEMTQEEIAIAATEDHFYKLEVERTKNIIAAEENAGTRNSEKLTAAEEKLAHQIAGDVIAEHEKEEKNMRDDPLSRMRRNNLRKLASVEEELEHLESAHDIVKHKNRADHDLIDMGFNVGEHKGVTFTKEEKEKPTIKRILMKRDAIAKNNEQKQGNNVVQQWENVLERLTTLDNRMEVDSISTAQARKPEVEIGWTSQKYQAPVHQEVLTSLRLKKQLKQHSLLGGKVDSISTAEARKPESCDNMSVECVDGVRASSSTSTPGLLCIMCDQHDQPEMRICTDPECNNYHENEELVDRSVFRKPVNQETVAVDSVLEANCSLFVTDKQNIVSDHIIDSELQDNYNTAQKDAISDEGISIVTPPVDRDLLVGMDGYSLLAQRDSSTEVSNVDEMSAVSFEDASTSLVDEMHEDARLSFENDVRRHLRRRISDNASAHEVSVDTDDIINAENRRKDKGTLFKGGFEKLDRRDRAFSDTSKIMIVWINMSRTTLGQTDTTILKTIFRELLTCYRNTFYTNTEEVPFDDLIGPLHGHKRKVNTSLSTVYRPKFLTRLLLGDAFAKEKAGSMDIIGDQYDACTKVVGFTNLLNWLMQESGGIMMGSFDGKVATWIGARLMHLVKDYDPSYFDLRNHERTINTIGFVLNTIYLKQQFTALCMPNSSMGVMMHNYSNRKKEKNLHFQLGPST